MLQDMKVARTALLFFASSGLLAACTSSTPPSADDVRAARQAWFVKRGEGEFTLKSLAVSGVNCAADGNRFLCSGHEVFVTLRKSRHVGPGGSTVVDQVEQPGEGDFKITLLKGDKGWVSTD